jgi:hypothetical protein
VIDGIKIGKKPGKIKIQISGNRRIPHSLLSWLPAISRFTFIRLIIIVVIRNVGGIADLDGKTIAKI